MNEARRSREGKFARAAVERLEPRCLLTAIADPADLFGNAQTLNAWGQNVYQKINASLQVPGSNLYAETASLDGTRSGGDSGFSYVWPESVMFRVLDDLVAMDLKTYTPVLRAFSDELYTRYWQSTSPGGYRSGVSAGADLFYDDNGHIAVALAEAYSLTGDPVYLNRAVQTYQFVLSGEDTAGGGGIYFSVPDHTSKDAISTLQAVRAGLLLYEITGQAKYLSDATRLYAWAATHIQQPNGLFRERFLLTGPNAGTSDGFTLINSAGIGLSSNLLFYDATGDAAYLREAQRIGRASLAAYFNAAGAINDEGFWAFELVDALDGLYVHDNNPTWLNSTTGAMNWLHANREDPNGHYGTLWARENYTPGTVRTSWNMIDQAAVAESYLRTASTNLVAPPFVTSSADLITGFYQGAVGGNDVPSGAGFGAGQYPAAEAPLNAVDDNPATKYLNFGNGDSNTSSAAKGVGTGFYVTPVRGPAIVTGIQVATANDNPSRDPLTVAVEGTNSTANFDAGATWTLIADNVDLGIATDPGRETYGPVVHFKNAMPYRSYRVIVKSQRGSDNSVQYAEMNLVGSAAPSITGAVWNDANHNGVRDPGEAGLSGVTVFLDLNKDGTLDASDPAAITDAGGIYSFSGLVAGTYTVRQVVPGGYAATAPLGYAGTVTISAAQTATGPTFGDVPLTAVPMDFSYLLLVARNYGQAGTFANGDLNGDSQVNLADLLILAHNFGHPAPQPAASSGSTALAALNLALQVSIPGDSRHDQGWRSPDRAFQACHRHGRRIHLRDDPTGDGIGRT